ncbi:MAG: hypothetical protein FJW61_01360 [Actinobacteria bacterium]|nr:hypothetical protein [Actinomycetota bacterium]
MEQQTIITDKITIDEIRSQLENWRQNKRNHREPIPKELWQAAADLAKKHSINTVSKALRLSYADLKVRLYGPSKPKPSKRQKPASFIELKCDSPLTDKETTLELQDLKRDIRLKISFKGSPVFDISSLIKSFCQSL